MTRVLVVFVAWMAVSLPAGCVVGKLLARAGRHYPTVDGGAP